MVEDFVEKAETITLEDDLGKFWESWEGASLKDRSEQVRKLVNKNLRYMLLENARFGSDREERLFLMALTTLLNSYFEDLYAFMIKKFADTISSATEIAVDEVKNNSEEEKKDEGENVGQGPQ